MSIARKNYRTYIEEEHNHLLLRFLTWAFFASIGVVLIVYAINTVSQQKSLHFIDHFFLSLVFLTEIAVIGLLIQTFNEKRKLIKLERSVCKSFNDDAINITIHTKETVDGKRCFWYTSNT